MSFSKGFIRGFIGQSLDKKAAADKLLGDLNTKVADRYLTEIQPNFIKNEKNIESRYNSISKNISEPVALYAMAQGFTNTDYDTNRLLQLEGPDLDQLKNYASTIDFGNYNFELAKNTRALKYNEKYSGVTNQIKTMAGGSGPAVTGLLIPYDETMGTSTFDASQLKPLTDISIGGNNYDAGNARHSAEESKAIRAFDRLFFDNRTNSYNFNERAEDDPVAPILKSLLDDYEMAKAQDYDGDRFSFIQDKFVSDRLSKKGIQNYPTVFDTKPVEEKPKEIEQPAIPQTENLFKSEAEIKEKTTAKKINPKSIRVTDEGVVGSPIQIVDTLRNTIAAINSSTTESDEGKQQKISNATEFAKNKLRQLGFDPDDFLN
jgi:hypothetical protein